MRAFLLSFDDGPSTGDFAAVLPLLKEHGLTAAFNMGMGSNPSSKSFLYKYDEDGNAIWINDYTSQTFKDTVVKDLEGFEVGNHGTDHLPDSRLTKDGIRKEIGLNKYNLETVFDKEVGGIYQGMDRWSPDSRGPCFRRVANSI